MARGKATSEETKAKVVEMKMLNTELSSYDISESLRGSEYEVSADTVQDILRDLPQLTATEKGARQIERLDGIIEGIEAITSKVVTTLSKKEDHTINDVKILNEIAKTNFERRQLLTGKNTAQVGVSGVKELSTAELIAQLEEK